MTDLTLDVEDYKLNIRAAGIIIHNGKVLVHRNTNSNHYALVGGRVEIGEDSVSTLKREIQEEMGKDIEIIGYISTIENFFEMEGFKYHEISARIATIIQMSFFIILYLLVVYIFNIDTCSDNSIWRKAAWNGCL